MKHLISIGDPCGIGPEIIVKAIQNQPQLKHQIAVVGDVGVMTRAASLYGFPGNGVR